MEKGDFFIQSTFLFNFVRERSQKIWGASLEQELAGTDVSGSWIISQLR